MFLTASQIQKDRKTRERNKETKKPSKPLYHIPKQVPKESKQPKDSDKEKDPDFEPKPKKQRKEKDKSEEKQYHSPKQIPNNLELPMEQVADADDEIVREFNNVPQEEITTNQLRRSRRLPKASNKYLEAIKAELQDSDNE